MPAPHPTATVFVREQRGQAFYEAFWRYRGRQSRCAGSVTRENWRNGKLEAAVRIRAVIQRIASGPGKLRCEELAI